MTSNDNSITYNSWQDRFNIKDFDSNFATYLYLELEKVCNAACWFCRNKYYPKCAYDLQSIKANLLRLMPYLELIKVGGGEPTLKYDDLLSVREFVLKNGSNYPLWAVITNGTKPRGITLSTIASDGFKIVLSRHAISDVENASIFRVNHSKITSNIELERALQAKNIDLSLSGTCTGRNLNTPDKLLEYIDYYGKMGINDISFSMLHLSGTTPSIEETSEQTPASLFDDTIEILQSSGYDKRENISSSGYDNVIMSSKGNPTVTFKKALTMEELDSLWGMNPSKSFDLLVTPSGDVFDSQRQDEKVTLCKLR